jgi:hypothetical protein
MACPNFKKGLKMVSGPLGVKNQSNSLILGLTNLLPNYLEFLAFSKERELHLRTHVVKLDQKNSSLNRII